MTNALIWAETLLSKLLTVWVSGPGTGVGHSAGAGSPFTDYDAGVAVAALLVGFLVSTLLFGGILILNLGLLSKRAEDWVGGRNPSQPGFLKTTTWPEEPYQVMELPAEEDEKERRKIA